MASIQYRSSDTDRRLKYLMILALSAALAYFVNRWVIIPQESSLLFFRCYVNDILALPVYIPLSLYLAVRLNIIPPEFRLGIIHILGAVILFSILFEGLLPVLDESITRDYWDIAAYFVGGILVLTVSRVSERSKINHS